MIASYCAVVNIGFVPSEYYVTEGDDFVNLNVEVISGQLGIHIVVRLRGQSEFNHGKKN